VAKRSVCLFCSAATGLSDTFMQAAEAFGTECARRNWRLVYGGSRNGLMGIAATAALAAGGEVFGVMPQFLVAREAAKRDITELRMCDTLAQRKEIMIEESDVFVCLPGGIGTLDELLEVLTTNDLGLHDKPIYLLNLGGFWEPFRAMVETFSAHGVMRVRAQTGYRMMPDLGSLLTAVDVQFGQSSRMGP
jgi:uncharacterized protein (TIGR00730 family)